MFKLIAVPVFLVSTVCAQKPVIWSGGVVNAATYAAPVAPGSIASIFGQNLSTAIQSAGSLPLPTALAGTSVYVDGVKAPLFYVSPGQINFQVPSNILGQYAQSGQSSVVVTTAAGTSDPVTAGTAERAAGFFTTDASGCGQAAVLNVLADHTTTINSPSNSATPGQFLEVFGTGLGTCWNCPPDGSPAVSDPLASVVWPLFDFDGTVAGPNFAGKAPGLAGVDQMNVMIPLDTREGCAVPVRADNSQTVTVSVRAGGGQCVDPPAGTGADIVIRTIQTLSGPGPEKTSTVTALFAAAPGLKKIASSVPAGRCDIPGVAALEAGVGTISGPAPAPISLQPSAGPRGVSYQATLGSPQPGPLTIAFTGGPQVGAFQTVADVGPDIEITSKFPPGGGLPNPGTAGTPVTVTWNGGTADELVTLRLLAHPASAGDYVVWSGDSVPGTAGKAIIIPFCAPPSGPAGTYCFFPTGGESTDLVVEVTSNPAAKTFVAPGLTLGGQVRWIHEYRFAAVYPIAN